MPSEKKTWRDLLHIGITFALAMGTAVIIVWLKDTNALTWGEAVVFLVFDALLASFWQSLRNNRTTLIVFQCITVAFAIIGAQFNPTLWWREFLDTVVTGAGIMVDLFLAFFIAEGWRKLKR